MQPPEEEEKASAIGAAPQTIRLIIYFFLLRPIISVTIKTINSIKESEPNIGTPHAADGSCFRVKSSPSIVALLHTIVPTIHAIHKNPESIAIFKSVFI